MRRPGPRRGILATLVLKTLVLTALVLSTGCATGVSLQVLQPSEVFVPPHIRKVAVIDRSRASSTGDTVLRVVEGMLTGEEIGADNAGRARALERTTSVLTASPRFEVTHTGVPPERMQSDLLGAELGPGPIRKLAQEYRCDGIVSLEAFDSDSRIDAERKVEESTDSDGKPVRRVYFQANRHTQVTAVWRLYDANRGVVIDYIGDRQRARDWTHQGDSPDQATAGLPSQADTVEELAGYLGEDYGRRIAPSYVSVVRYIYGSGDDRLKKARDHVRVNDWAGASAQWEAMRQDPNPKLRGKAKYNLAVSKEVDGDLDAALILAREGCVDFSKNRCREYVGVLEQRIRDRERVRQQMAPPPPPPPPPAAPPPLRPARVALELTTSPLKLRLQYSGRRRLLSR